MNLRSSFITAFRALKRNKMRSALTSIGIIIGVSSVIVMIGIGSSARIAVKDKITTFGTNAMTVYSSKTPLTIRDVEYIRRNFPQYVSYVTPVLMKDGLAKSPYKNTETSIFGVDNNFFKIKDWALQYGRYFEEEEIAANAKVVIIGNTARVQLFGYINPVGKMIVINNAPFMIIGVLTETGSSLGGSDFDNLMVSTIHDFCNTDFYNALYP